MIVMNKEMIRLLKKHGLPQNRLCINLQRILKDGIIESEGCFFLKKYYLLNRSHLNLKDFQDYTGYESFINGFHIDDYCRKNFFENGLIFCKKLAYKLDKIGLKYTIIFVHDTKDKYLTCHITFHTYHSGEPPYLPMEDLDNCWGGVLIIQNW